MTKESRLQMEIHNDIKTMMAYIGDDPDREGLLKTPDRVIRSYKELYKGYEQNPEDILKTVFKDGACNEMVILKDITGYSTCEHHILPFSFKAHVGYIPNGKVIGISKIARLVEMYAKRLQIQEKMTTQIADSLTKHLQPLGVMVIIKGEHLCMKARGVKQENSIMITSAVRGVFMDNPATRKEFLDLCQKGS